jgi:hypothetical protein
MRRPPIDAGAPIIQIDSIIEPAKKGVLWNPITQQCLPKDHQSTHKMLVLHGILIKHG